ncbi:MAG: tyrosine recombinase XerC [Clostridia bacterium]|nr:tyrosine recombinase XerC [Clostridia bacterium]
MISRDQNPDFLNEFLDYSSVTLNKSQNSIKEYNYDIALFLRFIKYHFGMVKVNDIEEIKTIPVNDLTLATIEKITLDDIRAFLAYLRNTYNSKPATLARKASTIRIFFKYLCNKSKKISTNPAQELENPKLDKRLPKYLTLEQSEKLLVASKSTDTKHGNHDNHERNFAIITLFLNCGMRLSELVGININDINFYDNKLNVIGKGNKERAIYLNNACVKAVQDYIAVRPKEGIKLDSKNALFLSERRERISNRAVQYIVKEELKIAGIDPNKYSVHKLRHTAATLMYKYGNVDIRALQELLGHESIATTEIYTHVDNEQVREAVEKNPLSDFGKKQ